MTLSAFWAELYQRRSAWAFQAHRRFLDSFHDPVLRESGRTPENVFVAVIGPSQVGKTTMILRLIGVDPRHEAVVSQALRGSRPPGNSATATAMIYAPSADDAYHIRRGPAEHSLACETEAEVAQVMDQIRAEVESGQARYTDPVEVSIPARYSLPRAPGDAVVTIVDLPGVGSATAAEWPHVDELLNRCLPAASLVLMVDQAHQLSAFGRTDIPAIDSLFLTPAKVRVVLTFAVSNDSVRRKMRPDTPISELRRHFEAEFKSTGSALPGLPEIYPLEFGRSWDQFLREHGGDRDWQGEMDSQVRELKAEIYKSADRYSHIRGNLRMYDGVKAYLKGKRSKLRHKARELRKRAHDLEQRVNSLAKVCIAEQKRTAVAAQAAAVIEDLAPSLTLAPDASPQVDKGTVVAPVLAWIAEQVGEAARTANDRLDDYVTNVQKQIDGCELAQVRLRYRSGSPEVREADLRRFAEGQAVVKRLKRPKWLQVFSRWSRDRAEAQAVLEEVLKLASSLGDEAAARYQSDTLAMLEGARVYHQRRARIAGWLAAKRRQRLAVAQAERERHAQAVSDFRTRGAHDVEVADRFRSYLTSAFQDEYRACAARSADPATPAPERWLYLCYRQLLLKEYRKLWEGR